MSVTTMTSREFNRDAGRAKRATKEGSVIITDRGDPAYVLMSFNEYQRLTAGGSIVDMLAMPGPEVINFEPGRADIGLQPADLS